MELTTAMRERIRGLWAQNRLLCGWFLRKNFDPQTDDDLVRCARLLEKHGDRQTYVTVRKLMKCL